MSVLGWLLYKSYHILLPSKSSSILYGKKQKHRRMAWLSQSPTFGKPGVCGFKTWNASVSLNISRQPISTLCNLYSEFQENIVS